MEPQEYSCPDGSCPVCEDRCMTLDDEPCHVSGQSEWYMYRCECVGEVFAFEDRPLTEQELQKIVSLMPKFEE